MSNKRPASATDPLMHPWQPMKRPIDLKHMGKFAEELGECLSAVARCMIQGIEECEPITGKKNRYWLEEEIADVLANIELNIKHFDLNQSQIQERKVRKIRQLRSWHEMLEE